MTEQIPIPGFESRRRAITIIAAAILLSVFFYALVAAVIVASQGIVVGSELPQILPPILAAIAVGLLFAAPTLHRIVEKAGGATADTPETRLEAYQKAMIVAFAAREGAAVIGLAISMLTGDLRWCFGLCALTALAMVLAWPRREHLDRLTAETHAAPPPIG